MDAENLKVHPLVLRGVKIYPGYIDATLQAQMLADVRKIVRCAPLVAPQTPGGGMSVRMTSAGKFGWVTDKSGYHYAERHPLGSDWPDIPVSILRVWKQVSAVGRPPDSCLVNFYGKSAHMGMHRDKDEADFDIPVVSISLGDDALFRVGNLTKGGKTASVWLKSGDVAVIGGAARQVFHGVDRIRFKSSALLPAGGRINLTLRAAK